MGTSKILSNGFVMRKDHPHACGDKLASASEHPGLLGSSPRVWGQVTVYSPVGSSARIIPTRVGTSTIFMIITVIGKDHPHACGDKHIFWRLSYFAVGSSPRVWGQALVAGAVAVYCGIIPTRVVTRLLYSSSTSFSRDHPHACGDKNAYLAKNVCRSVSSPRVWGQGRYITVGA